MKYLVFCKAETKIIGTLECSSQLIPYYIRCPFCGPEQAVTYVHRMKPPDKRCTRKARFSHFMVHTRKKKILNTLRQLGFDLTIPRPNNGETL